MNMNRGMPVSTLKLLRSKKLMLTLLVLAFCFVIYFHFFHSVTISPAVEAEQMKALEITKQMYDLEPFRSDGCSGNVSNLWKSAVTTLSTQSPEFSEKYSATQDIPFEAACIAHDKLYHKGTGGYVGRLRADNDLRTAILDYATTNSEDIKVRTGFSSTEQVIYMYEFIAESVYRGVRLGGAPCTGMSYAWGFGYNNGSCE